MRERRAMLAFFRQPGYLQRGGMEQLLWYLLAGSRGGYNRIRIIEALKERPFNAHQLAEKLGLDYRTIRHHLDLLVKNNVLARPAGDAYGSMYFLSGLMKASLEVFEKVRGSVAAPSGEIMAKGDKSSSEVE
jgi:DNA-binding transcriptional ArsR family regulator